MHSCSSHYIPRLLDSCLVFTYLVCPCAFPSISRIRDPISNHAAPSSQPNDSTSFAPAPASGHTHARHRVCMLHLLRRAAGDGDDLACKEECVSKRTLCDSYLFEQVRSIGENVPLTQPPSSEARKATTRATSSGSRAALERAVLSHELLDLVGWPLWGAAGDVVPVE